MSCKNFLLKHLWRWACKASEKENERLREKLRYKTVVLYHARLRLGMEGWIKVMEDYKQFPTINSILGKEEESGEP
jgi:hypothetical protein